MKYFALSDATESCFEANIPRSERIFRPGGCRECSTLAIGIDPPELLVVKETITGVAALSITSWLFGVIHASVLEALGEPATKLLRVGMLKDAKGQLLSNYRTFAAVDNVIPRGNAQSQHRLCSLCGAFVYSYSPTSKPYVTTWALQEQLAVYGFGMLELLLSEPMLDKIESKWRKLIDAIEVEVRDTPDDGLRAGLSPWPDKKQLVGYSPNLPPWMKK